MGREFGWLGVCHALASLACLVRVCALALGCHRSMCSRKVKETNIRMRRAVALVALCGAGSVVCPLPVWR
jgi:hypothetical protein